MDDLIIRIFDKMNKVEEVPRNAANGSAYNPTTLTNINDPTNLIIISKI